MYEERLPQGKGDRAHIVTSDGTIVCYGSGTSCGVAGFLPASRRSKFHDDALAELTRRLSDLIEEHEPRVPDGMELRFLRVPDEGLFLAYARCQDDAVEGTSFGEDDVDDMKRALGIA
jgi:hypothetical protein